MKTVISIVLFLTISSNVKGDILHNLKNLLTSPTRIHTSTIPYLATGIIGIPYLINRDIIFYNDVQKIKSPFLDDVAPFVNLLGDGYFHLGLTSVLFAYGSKRDKEIAKVLFEGFITAGVVSSISKMLFSATRPGDNDKGHKFFEYLKLNGGFPSGHTTIAFSQASILGYYYGIGYLTYPLACLVGIARIYSGAHWPSDVLFGALIGIWVGNEVIRSEEQEENQIYVSPFLERSAFGIRLLYKF